MRVDLVDEQIAAAFKTTTQIVIRDSND